MSCKFCETVIYVKTTRYLMPVIKPATRAEELRQELVNITGEDYLPIENIYCPVCGKKIR